MCQRRIRIRELGGGFVTGQDSDLLIRMKGKHIIQAEIHTCRHCRFSGYADDFSARKISSRMVKRFFDEVAEQLRDEESGGVTPTPMPHVQYRWAALVAPVIGLTATQSGLRMARGYWSLRLKPAINLEPAIVKRLRKRYLRAAISRLRQGLRHEKDRSSLVYFIGELCRRNGNFLLAKHYFERFLEREAGPRYLKLAAEKLLEAARRSDATEKTMEAVLYGEATEHKRAGRKPERE